MGSDSTLPNRIGFCPSRWTGISKVALSVPLIFLYTIRGYFIGARNDFRAFFADQESLFTSALVYDGTESEGNAEK